MIKLERPTIGYKEKALDYRWLYFEHGEFIISGSELLDKTDSYEDWLKEVTANASSETVNRNLWG